MWKPDDLKLRWPVVNADGEPLAALPVRAFTVEEHRAALERAGEDEHSQFEQLAVLATGHPLTVIESLKRPDFISLTKRIAEYVNLPASYFSGQKPADPDEFPLLVPIKGMGRTYDTLTLRVPSMGATKAMMKHKDELQRTDFISAHCTGLAVAELLRLSIPDWTQLQVRLNDFLNQPADYFQSATSK